MRNVVHVTVFYSIMNNETTVSNSNCDEIRSIFLTLKESTNKNLEMKIDLIEIHLKYKKYIWLTYKRKEYEGVIPIIL
jgi:hypothetical protein